MVMPITYTHTYTYTNTLSFRLVERGWIKKKMYIYFLDFVLNTNCVSYKLLSVAHILMYTRSLKSLWSLGTIQKCLSISYVNNNGFWTNNIIKCIDVDTYNTCSVAI